MNAIYEHLDQVEKLGVVSEMAEGIAGIVHLQIRQDIVQCQFLYHKSLFVWHLINLTLIIEIK